MDNSTEVSHTIESFRVRVSSNRQLVLILSENIKDLRVKRIASLLEEITPHSEAICISTQQVYEICQNAHILHRGFHPQLSFLKEEMVTASSYLAEVLKRILLYLEHMQIIGSKLPGNIMHLTKSAITEQKQLADQLRLQAFQAIKTAVSRTPGPGVMPHKNCHNAAAEEKKDLRPLFNNQPLPMGDEYDARWDPDFKVPGSQYSKFLRFSGPFFASNEVGDAIFDDFRLPETVGSLIDSWTSKYDGVKSNFKETHRLPRRVTSRAKNALIARQKSLNISIAKNSGRPYDPESLSLFIPIHPRDTAPTAGAYLSSALKVKSSRLGAGIWELEDMNRVLETQITKSHRLISPMDGGRQAYFARKLNLDVGYN